MRPEKLNTLFAAADSLKGVGDAVARPLARLDLTRVRDFLYHLPNGFVDRQRIATLDDAPSGSQVLVELTPVQYRASAGRGPFRVLASDSIGNICSLAYFGRNQGWAKKLFPLGETKMVAGRLDIYGQEWQIVHPDHVLDGAAADRLPAREAIYPLSEGMTQGRLAALIAQALARTEDLPEWIEPGLLDKMGWPTWRDALHLVHAGPHGMVRDRLAYDELFANQLALTLLRQANRTRKGQKLRGDGSLTGQLNLPFALTGAQARSIDEVRGDMEQASSMLRLLQGDVGSGKTMVALHAMLIAVEAGAQAALLAPTEILARQHFATIRKQVAGLIGRNGQPVEVALLTGRDKGKAREATLMGIADGGVHIIIGTHAIFQEAVQYRNLGMVVIDEQHRFGVGQRLMLTQKGKAAAPHCLAMTATPIPRTLTLSHYGEMDVSRLDELPPGRQPIDTRVVSTDRLDDVANALARHLSEGKQAYWVCPMVTGSETSDLAAAEERFAALQARFGDAVALVHGQMRGEVKDAAMERFASGQASLLVATTVIEVGVDVPNATLMVIEQAERFGLAQLHQLRGRVGRGEGQSTCLLLRGNALSETARQRLALMRETQDGFRLAEEDLRLRGGGEILGTRQSGDSPYRVAEPEQVQRLLPIAHDDARLLVDRDGGLDGPRGDAARMCLYLFERDYGVSLLRSG